LRGLTFSSLIALRLCEHSLDFCAAAWVGKFLQHFAIAGAVKLKAKTAKPTNENDFFIINFHN
ncbi:hypothetical protein, partial [Kingella kingae]|uniref:hypothetical protein n=1 Tax=Kingella kingae TaxID=504 RepID=UPI001E294CC6